MVGSSVVFYHRPTFIFAIAATTFMWNFLFPYVIFAISICISLVTCCGKKKEQKTEQKVQTKKSKAKEGKSKTDAKQSKKHNEEKAEGGNKNDAVAESKAENELKSEDADRGDNQKEKTPAKLPESIDVIDEPRKFLPETPEEQEAYRNILQGKWWKEFVLT
uniref:Lipoprotein n=2 Tax=Parascaris univalens TaxID=6257 RepID=A0A915BJE0_PARUN